MKYLSLLYGCCFAFILIEVDGETVAQKIALLREKCAAENGLEKDDISVKNAATFLTNPKAKCYLRCIAENLGLFEEDSSVDKPKFVGYFEEKIREKVLPIISKCSEAGGIVPDRCEKAYNTIKCISEEDFNLYKNFKIFDPIVAV